MKNWQATLQRNRMVNVFKLSFIPWKINCGNLGKIDPKLLCPWESGRQYLSLPESEVLERLMSQKMGEKKAKVSIG